jgi:hypothetical protein
VNAAQFCVNLAPRERDRNYLAKKPKSAARNNDSAMTDIPEFTDDEIRIVQNPIDDRYRKHVTLPVQADHEANENP